MTIEEARGLAAQAWCHERNKNTIMDCNLAESFAEIMVREIAAEQTRMAQLVAELADDLKEESGS